MTYTPTSFILLEISPETRFSLSRISNQNLRRNEKKRNFAMFLKLFLFNDEIDKTQNPFLRKFSFTEHM